MSESAPDPRQAVIARAIHEAECEAYTHEGRNAKCERAARAAVIALDAAATGQDTTDPADGLSEVERESLVEALYSSRIGEYGYFGRPECEQFVEPIVPAVERILAARQRPTEVQS